MHIPPPPSGILRFDSHYCRRFNRRFQNTLTIYLGGEVLFLRFIRNRLFLLSLLFLSLFALTACNRKDDGVSPIQHSDAPTLQMNLENASVPFNLTPSEIVRKAQNQQDSGRINPNAPQIRADGQPHINLALSAIADASSVFGANTPDRANNNETFDDFWHSENSFSTHWYRLVWSSPVTISHSVILWCDHYLMASLTQTLTDFYYFDLETNQWKPIPSILNGDGGGFFSPLPFISTDLIANIFPPITTTGIIWFMRGDPVEQGGVRINVTFVDGPVNEIAKIKIKNLDAPMGVDPFAENASVSYRAAKTRFQTIGYRADDTEIGPISAEWGLEGGNVTALEQLRMGILSGLGQNNTKIGNIDNGFLTIASASTVTFNSYLPGNITLTAKVLPGKGNASDSVAIRIKQPTFKVKVYPVEGINLSGVFNTWKDFTEQAWTKENIIKIDSIELQSEIQNVTYPNHPLTQPWQGAEILFDEFGQNPSYSNPLVYDWLLGLSSGRFIVPRQASLLLSKGNSESVNIYVVRQNLSYWVDGSHSPPLPNWNFPEIFPVSTRDYFLSISQAGLFIRENPLPSPSQYTRYLAAGIGRIFGLSQLTETTATNLMNLSSIGGLVLNPDQFIEALNYHGDNTQSTFFFTER